jgi:hypothetical protein
MMQLREGREEHSHADVLRSQLRAERKNDTDDEARLAAGAEAQGLPRPLPKWESKRNLAAFEGERETTPVTKADLRRFDLELIALKHKLGAALKRRGGSRTTERGDSRTRHRSSSGPTTWSYLPPIDRE